MSYRRAFPLAAILALHIFPISNAFAGVEDIDAIGNVDTFTDISQDDPNGSSACQTDNRLSSAGNDLFALPGGELEANSPSCSAFGASVGPIQAKARATRSGSGDNQTITVTVSGSGSCIGTDDVIAFAFNDSSVTAFFDVVDQPMNASITTSFNSTNEVDFDITLNGPNGDIGEIVQDRGEEGGSDAPIGSIPSGVLVPGEYELTINADGECGQGPGEDRDISPGSIPSKPNYNFTLTVTIALSAGPATGACCSETGDCTQTTQSDCPNNYQGDGSTCSASLCGQCVDIAEAPRGGVGIAAVGDTLTWNNSAGGSYTEPTNWDPEEPPTTESKVLFAPVGGVVIYEVDAISQQNQLSPAAVADRWRVSNADVLFSGTAQLFNSVCAAALSIGNDGRLQLVEGTTSFLSPSVSIGVGGNGILELRGLNTKLITEEVNINTGDEGGTLRIEGGAAVEAGNVTLNAFSAGQSIGVLVLDGQLNPARLTLSQRLEVSAGDGANTTEVDIKNNAILTTGSVILGADASQDSDFTLMSLSSDSSAEAKLQVTQTAAGDVTTKVGERGAASLQILNGGFAELAGGLAVGSGTGGGDVLVANRQSTGLAGGPGRQAAIKVLGTAVLIGAKSRADVFVENGGLFESTAPVAVGLIQQASPTPSRIIVKTGAELKADGQTISIGVNSPGELNLNGFNSRATCRRLAVGGQTAGTGTVALQSDARLTATEAIQIGSGQGIGTGAGIVTVGDGCSLLSDGRLFVGGGGTGKLTLFDRSVARASVGTTVQSNGSIEGTGTLRSNVTVTPPGFISPGVIVPAGFIVQQADKSVQGLTIQQANSSIGELTIDGNYAPEDGAVLIIEVAGTAPGEFDVLHVTGDAALAGQLDLRFINGFEPRTGDVFEFLVVDGTTTGQFTGELTFPINNGDTLVDVDVTLTPEGTIRVTVTDVRPARPGFPLFGLCGFGVTSMFALTLLGLWFMKRRGLQMI